VVQVAIPIIPSGLSSLLLKLQEEVLIFHIGQKGMSSASLDIIITSYLLCVCNTLFKTLPTK